DHQLLGIGIRRLASGRLAGILVGRRIGIGAGLGVLLLIGRCRSASIGRRAALVLKGTLEIRFMAAGIVTHILDLGLFDLEIGLDALGLNAAAGRRVI